MPGEPAGTRHRSGPRHAAGRRAPLLEDPGVEANARLTGATGAVLLVLLALEGVTILQIRGLLTLHVFVGMLLVPPVALKIGATGWRFARYYRGDPAYRRKGPPVVILRLLGPFVVVLTVVVFASGIVLVLGPHNLRNQVLFIHKASFILWFAATAVHVLGHLRDTARLAPGDWVGRARRRVGGATTRQGVLVVSLAVGAVLGAVTIGQVNHYVQQNPHHHGGQLRGRPARSGDGPYTGPR